MSQPAESVAWRKGPADGPAHTAWERVPMAVVCLGQHGTKPVEALPRVPPRGEDV